MYLIFDSFLIWLLNLSFLIKSTCLHLFHFNFLFIEFHWLTKTNPLLLVPLLRHCFFSRRWHHSARFLRYHRSGIYRNVQVLRFLNRIDWVSRRKIRNCCCSFCMIDISKLVFVKLTDHRYSSERISSRKLGDIMNSRLNIDVWLKGFFPIKDFTVFILSLFEDFRNWYLILFWLT